MGKIEPTREAVLAVFKNNTAAAREQQETLRTEGRLGSSSPFRAFRLVAVAEGIGARIEWSQHAWDSYDSQMRRQVNVPALQKILDELVAEGAIGQAKGTSGVAGVPSPHGARAGTVYWYDGAQVAWASEKRSEAQQAELRKKAQEQVLAAHADEVEAAYQELLAIQYALDMSTR